MTVRAGRLPDLPRIAAIYDEQVRTAISTFDLEPLGLDYWEARLASTAPGDHLLVALADSDVVGYAYSTSYRRASRPTPAPARSRSISPAKRGSRASGGRCMRSSSDRLRTDGIHQVLAVIALPNDASEALHRACGFSRVGVLPEVGWKFNRWIDTALWGLTL